MKLGAIASVLQSTLFAVIGRSTPPDPGLGEERYAQRRRPQIAQGQPGVAQHREQQPVPQVLAGIVDFAQISLELCEAFMLVRRIELNGGEDFTPAWEVSPESGLLGGAAIFHGYGSAKESMLGLALALSGAGLSCTVPDVCGHGEHPGRFGPSVVEDVRRTVEHARSRGPVLAVGHSMGARLAMLADADAVVAVSPALPVQPSPEGMYALRTFPTPRVRQARPGQVVEILRDLPMRPARPVPVLVLVGEGDVASITRTAEDLVSSLDEAELVHVAEGMILEAEEPPPGFGPYIKHWTNHETLPATRAVATETVRWAQRLFPSAR